MPVYHSAASQGVRIGVKGVASSAFSASALMQSYDVETKGDEIECKDGNGEVVAWYGYNGTREASFTYYVGSATANASASVSRPAFGSMITVTEAVPGSDAAGTTWIVKSSATNATNTDAVKVTVKATEYPAVTS